MPAPLFVSSADIRGMAIKESEIWDGAHKHELPVSLGKARAWRWFRGWFDTVKARLTLAAVGCLIVGIGSVSLLSQHRVERDLLLQTQERELGQTTRMASDLAQRSVDLQQALRSVADRLSPAFDRPDDDLERQLLSQSALFPRFANLFVADDRGQIRLMIDGAGSRRPQVSIADRAYFQQVLADRRPVISDAVPGRVSGDPVIVFCHPILRNDKVIAVLAGTIRLSSRSLAAGLLRQDIESSPVETLAISDDAGRILAHPSNGLLLKPLAQDPHLSAAFEEWQALGSPVEPAGLILTQPGGVVTAAGVAGTNWVVWRSLPESMLLGPVRASRLQTLRDAIWVVVVLGLLTFWLIRQQLAPLQRLQLRARSLFEQGQDVHVGWPNARGEIGSLVQVLRHVGAERAHLEAFTSQLLDRLHSVLAAAPLGIAFTRDQRFELVSQTWCRLLQREESDLLGSRAVEAFADEQDYLSLGRQVGEAFLSVGEYAGEWRFRRRDGSTFWGQLCGRPVAAENPAAGTIWTLSDVTSSRADREHLQWSATHDGLTGLANRGAIEARMVSALGHAPSALVVIDLDRFKPINDTHGHAAGDAMLKVVASVLLTKVRSGDLVARLGGDEFAVLLERCPSEVARRIAGDLQRAIACAELEWAGQVLGVGASVGVAPWSDSLTTVDSWCAAADAACYAAKDAGRGTTRMFAPGSGNVVPLPNGFARREGT